MPCLRTIITISLLMGFELTAVAQQVTYDPSLQTGVVPFQSYHGSDIDSINLATGELSLHIPLVSFPQLGGKIHQNYSIVYTSPGYQQVTTCPLPMRPCVTSWLAVQGGGSGLVQDSRRMGWTCK